VVEQTKRIRHKAGLEEELHQYVLYDTQERKGPKRINLDDTTDKSKNKYVPPENLTVHLSKIAMPELQPRVKSAPDDKPPVVETKKEKKEQKKREEAKRKEDKKVAVPPTPNKLTRPGRNGSPPHKSYQPSPSPSQLNYPAIYAAPPPPRNPPHLSLPGPPPLPSRPHSADENPSSHSLLTPSTIVSGIFDMLHRPRSTS